MPNPSKRVTSFDVARKAGVSRATVSMVLNDRTQGTVSADTRERVLRAAEELQYTRSRAALSLREQRSHSIGIVSDEILTSPWAGRMLRAADAYAYERGYVTLSMDLSIPGMSQESAVRTLQEREVDGIVFATMGALEVTIPDTIAQVPIVLLNCFNSVAAKAESLLPDFSRVQRFSREGGPTAATCGPSLFPEFVPDDYQGGYRAAERLLDVGHTRIAMITGTDSAIAKRARDAGFMDACAAAGVEPRLVNAGWNFNDGYRAGMELLSEPSRSRPTGVFCIRDRVAAGMLNAAATRGVSVPHELSVVGFDDEDFFAEMLVPALTTIALPHIDMGRTAMASLVELIEGSRNLPSQRSAFECPIVERDTVAQPPQ